MKNEELFGVMAEKAPAMMWVAGPDGRRTNFNQRWLDFTGRPADVETDNGWTEGIHADDLDRCLGICSESFDRRREFIVEYRLRRHDGQYRWVCDSGVPWFQTDGSFAGYVGSCFDITLGKLAAEGLSRLTGHLMQAYEQERMALARELHDDIGCSLGTLGIELLGAGKPGADAAAETRPDIQEIYEKLQEIGSRVSRLSHELHPPILKYFGLAKAIETECRKFSKANHIPVSCSCEDFRVDLDSCVALSFLRVLQEALGNAGRHSHATSISVGIIAGSTDLTLTVVDDGLGFDLEQSQFVPGDGLMSMRERIRLIGGECEIWSQPGKGTKITCRAPLAQPVTSAGS